jgi:enamine deaminase RidA (YjgF/YER057c/UK114 family)
MPVIERLDPPELAPIPGTAHITTAKGSTVIHISGQTATDVDGQIVGTTLQAQTAQALHNLQTAIAAAGVTPADLARIGIYVVDYGPESLDAIVTAAIEVFGEDFPVTAGTLIGVATLWQPGLLIEIDAVAVV